MYSSKIIIGDRYADGHGRSENFNLVSAISPEEIQNAYADAVKIVGFDFANDCCADSEDSYLSSEYAEMLKEAGINLEKVESYDDQYSLDVDSFVDILIQMIKLGNCDAEIEIVPDNVIPTLRLNGSHSYGYGLYSH